MRNFYFLSLLFLALMVPTLAQTPLAQTPKVMPLQLPAGSTAGEVQGNIADGIQIPMRWAERSSVALVPGTRFEQFNGNQVFYRIEMPAASTIKVRMVPENGKKINLYALRQSVQGQQQVPPNVTSAISSEASYPIYANTGRRRIQNKDKGYREVEFDSVNRPYSILIGVSGAEGELEGNFLLNIQITPR